MAATIRTPEPPLDITAVFPELTGLAKTTFWRRAADVMSVLRQPPRPVFDDEMNARDWDPVPCVLHPEPVTEYPDSWELPATLNERIREWDNSEDDDEGPLLHPQLYWSSLSTAPATPAACTSLPALPARITRWASIPSSAD